MRGEGTPEGLAAPRRHGLHAGGLVELPLKVEHHDKTAGFGEAHLAGYGAEERLVNVAGNADEVRLTELEADSVGAPVPCRGVDPCLVLGHIAGVAGLGQPGQADAVGDVPPSRAVDDCPADVERPALVRATGRLGHRELLGAGQQPGAGRP